MNQVNSYTPEPTNLLIGAIIGTIAGLLIGYVIWSRHKNEMMMLGELKWSQLVASLLVMVCLLIKAPETVTIALIALIPAEAVAISLARRGGK